MKKIAIILIVFVAFATTSTAQNQVYHGTNFDFEIVSVDASYASRNAVITLKIKAKNDGEISFGSEYSNGFSYVEEKIVAWDGKGGVFTTPDGMQYCTVSQGIFVKATLNKLPLYLPNCDNVIHTLRLGRENAVFHNIPVNWHPVYDTDDVEVDLYAEEIWGAKGSTEIKILEPTIRNVYQYSKHQEDSAYVVAAVGNRRDHRVVVFSYLKLQKPMQDFGSQKGYVFLRGEAHAQGGLVANQLFGTTRASVEPGKWTVIATTYVLPSFADTLSEVVVYTLDNNDNNIYGRYNFRAYNVPIQWEDIPVAAVTTQDLIKMIGKNCVGKVKLGTRLTDIPQAIEGMYSNLSIEEVYSKQGHSGNFLHFYSNGEEIMYGSTFDEKGWNTGKLQWLEIDDGVLYYTVKFQK